MSQTSIVQRNTIHTAFTDVTLVARAAINRAFVKGRIHRWAVSAWITGAIFGIALSYTVHTGIMSFTVLEISSSAIFGSLLVLSIATANFVTKDIDEGVITGEKIIFHVSARFYGGGYLAGS